MKRVETDVVVIGGGSTGLGVVRDAAMRGYRAVLVERVDLGEGTTGRFHGLLHSGGRYVVSDPQSATECAEENAILCRIQASAVEDTGKEKCDAAQAFGKPLFDMVKQAEQVLAACDTEACRWRIENSTGLRTVHPIVLAHQAYGLGAVTP